MKNNVYESAVMINAALDDEQINNMISHIKDLIVNNGGEIREIENWGRKRLAYMVKKSKIGYYAIFRFNAPSNIVSKLERSYVLDEHILRFLTIELDSDAIEHLEKAKLNAQAAAEGTPEKAEVVKEEVKATDENKASE